MADIKPQAAPEVPAAAPLELVASAPPLTASEATPLTSSGVSSSDTVVARKNALFAALGRLREGGSQLLKQSKPWPEFVDRNSFSKPSNMSEAVSRVKKNWSYFKINYFILVLGTTCVCMILNPSSLLVLSILLAVWFYLFVIKTDPLVIAGRTISDREKLIGMSGISLVTVFFLTSVGTTLLYGLSLSMGIAALHGAMRVPDDLFIDEGQQSSAGSSMLSFLQVPATTGPNAV